MSNNTIFIYFFVSVLFVAADSNSINRMLSNSNQPGTGKNRYLLNICYCYTIFYSRQAVTLFITLCVWLSNCSVTHEWSFFHFHVIIIIHNIHRYRSNNNTSSGKGQYHQNDMGHLAKTTTLPHFSPVSTIGVGFGHCSNGNESKAFVTFGLCIYSVYTIQLKPIVV